MKGKWLISHRFMRKTNSSMKYTWTLTKSLDFFLFSLVHQILWVKYLDEHTGKDTVQATVSRLQSSNREVEPKAKEKFIWGHTRFVDLSREWRVQWKYPKRACQIYGKVKEADRRTSVVILGSHEIGSMEWKHLIKTVESMSLRIWTLGTDIQ